MIRVKVDQLLLSNLGFAVVLKSIEDERSLPIVIGAAEAQSIAVFINKVEMPRPITHDLLKNLLDFLECRLTRIEIHNLESGTFFANLILEQDGKELTMDARPSDAIAMAIRCNAQIYVHKRVMNEAGIMLNDQQPQAPGKESDKTLNMAENTGKTPMESMLHDLEKAIKEERYEDAAKLRDEIKRIEKAHAKN